MLYGRWRKQRCVGPLGVLCCERAVSVCAVCVWVPLSVCLCVGVPRRVPIRVRAWLGVWLRFGAAHCVFACVGCTV